MSATDELRRLLDERGVEYRVAFDGATEWDSCAGDYSSAVDVGDGKLVFTGCLTPIQAVEATLGRGECHVETTDNWLPARRYHRCKTCGAFFAVMDASDDIAPRYCPNCGREVVYG